MTVAIRKAVPSPWISMTPPASFSWRYHGENAFLLSKRSVRVSGEPQHNCGSFCLAKFFR